MASYDVDSVCAVKIMQYLFRLDDNPYTLVNVEGIDDLRNKFNDYRMVSGDPSHSMKSTFSIKLDCTDLSSRIVICLLMS